jgi:rubrerythrin
MVEQVLRESSTVDDGFIHFFPAGSNAKGEYHCSDCGYGVTVFRALPRCPMCGGETWEQSTWSPFRAYTHQV